MEYRVTEGLEPTAYAQRHRGQRGHTQNKTQILLPYFYGSDFATRPILTLPVCGRV